MIPLSIKLKMPIIWKARTQEAYYIKVLAELLQNNIKTACFEIDEKGISLSVMDGNNSILIRVNLDSECFSLYRFRGAKIYIGINLTHFHRMLKTIKKKDSLQLFINSNSPDDLGIRVIPKENTRVTTSFIKIQRIQNIDIEYPIGYGKQPVIVPSGEFQKLVKELIHIGNQIKVCSKGFHISFESDAGGVMKRHVEFGEFCDSSDEEDEKKTPEYKEIFDTEQFSRITKLAGLSSHIQIYPKQGQPLLFKSAIGALGRIAVYIKSKEQITRDANIGHLSESDQEEYSSNGEDNDNNDDEDDEDDVDDDADDILVEQKTRRARK